jgi:predicted HTH transcriptional regulator
MLERCRNTNHKDYKNYGARGISISEDWLVYLNFLRDMGERPRGTQIDRIDNNKGYFSGNCRWATPRENSSNRRSTRLVDLGDEKVTVAELARRLNTSRQTIRHRLEAGWTVEQIINTKPHKGNGWKVGSR